MSVHELLEASIKRVAAMSEVERKAMLDAQAKSYARSLLPCEHGMVDWENCQDCRANARDGA